MHLATVFAAFVIGTYLLLNRKGMPRHKLLGRIYLPMMLVTGIATLLMPAVVEPQFLGHFGFIHLFSLFILYSVAAAYIYARRGNIAAHKGPMLGLYIGAADRRIVRVHARTYAAW